MGACISLANTKGKRRKDGAAKQKTEDVNSNLPKKATAKLKSRTLSNADVPLGKITNFGYSRNYKERYQQGKLLGHGQFGYTYVATDTSTGEKVAVKTIEKKKMRLPIAVEDVKREVKIMRAMSGHENVVQFFEAFEDENYVYIAME